MTWIKVVVGSWEQKYMLCKVKCQSFNGSLCIMQFFYGLSLVEINKVKGTHSCHQTKHPADPVILTFPGISGKYKTQM